ncbi:MAG: hypothetical protein FWF59_15585 [Turicibacter sp.]|nr:hypothetical protein [Turicibacter sp.]
MVVNFLTTGLLLSLTLFLTLTLPKEMLSKKFFTTVVLATVLFVLLAAYAAINLSGRVSLGPVSFAEPGAWVVWLGFGAGFLLIEKLQIPWRIARQIKKMLDGIASYRGKVLACGLFLLPLMVIAPFLPGVAASYFASFGNVLVANISTNVRLWDEE